jgi:hypothetical protein
MAFSFIAFFKLKIGDVRAGSVERVAAAIGEGVQMVVVLHAFLAEAGDKPALSINSGSL